MSTKKIAADSLFHDDGIGEFEEVTETQNGRRVYKLSEKLKSHFDDGETVITVYRKAKRGRNHAFLFEVDEYEDLAALQLQLRDEYGGGDFQIEGRNPDGSWAFKEGLTIEPPKTESKEPAPQDNNFQSILLAMQQANEKSSREGRELMQQMQMQMMQQQQASMEMMFKTLSAQQRPAEGLGVSDMLGMITTLLPVMRPPEKADNFELFFKGLELGKEVTGGGGDDNILQTALKTFGGPLSKITEQLAVQQAGQSAPAHAPAQQNPQIQPPATTQAPAQTQEDADMMEILRLKPEFDKLFAAATRNDDVNTWVKYALTNVDLNMLGKYVCDEGHYNRLFAIAPAMVGVKPWLDTFRAQVIDCFQRESYEPRDLTPETPPVKDKPADFFGGDSADVHGQDGHDGEADYISGDE